MSELGDLSELSRAVFEARRDELMSRHPDWTKEGVKQAWTFSQVREGDRVVANRGTTKVLGVGTVAGPYYFVPDTEHGHRVPVTWDDLTPRRVKEEGWRRTLVELDREKFEASVAAPATDDGEPPPVEPTFDVHPAYALEQCAAETGLDVETLARWVRAVERKGQAVFYGPPGTGTTFVAERIARHLVAGGDGVLSLVQFHPAYAYEDFVQGIRPQARAGGGSLRIPPNVRLIGTMNTADRSIALVDHALRRRFAFLALAPNFDVLRNYHAGRGTPVEGLIETLEQLNKAIGDPHYAVGTSFFLRPDLPSQIEDIWKMEIEPYVEEYFFDQPAKAEAFRWDNVRSRVVG